MSALAICPKRSSMSACDSSELRSRSAANASSLADASASRTGAAIILLSLCVNIVSYRIVSVTQTESNCGNRVTNVTKSRFFQRYDTIRYDTIRYHGLEGSVTGRYIVHTTYDIAGVVPYRMRMRIAIPQPQLDGNGVD